MRSIYQGLISILDSFAEMFIPNQYKLKGRLDRFVKDSEERSKWYHRGEWWEHLLYRNPWDDRRK